MLCAANCAESKWIALPFFGAQRTKLLTYLRDRILLGSTISLTMALAKCVRKNMFATPIELTSFHIMKLTRIFRYETGA